VPSEAKGLKDDCGVSVKKSGVDCWRESSDWVPGHSGPLDARVCLDVT
jgi:hypothetical protein